MSSPESLSGATAGSALAAAVNASWHDWVERIVRLRLGSSDSHDPAVVADVCRATAEAIGVDIGQQLSALLSLDSADQSESPLEVMRGAARYVGAALDALGVERPSRDHTQELLFPADPHDVGPASFADLGPSVQHAGLAWAAVRIAGLG